MSATPARSPIDRPGQLEGEPVLAMFVADGARPSYFILAWDAGKLQQIRDFRYIPYQLLTER